MFFGIFKKQPERQLKGDYLVSIHSKRADEIRKIADGLFEDKSMFDAVDFLRRHGK